RTSVDGDDLPDFGAWAFAETIRQIKQHVTCSVEVLVPDFQGNEDSIRAVLDASPDIYNHNTETVPRLYKRCRPGGRYERVMRIFTTAKQMAPHIPTKSGIILGMGETNEEVLAVMRDLRAVDVDIITLGQYLRPSSSHIRLDRYVTPDDYVITTDRDHGQALARGMSPRNGMAELFGRVDGVVRGKGGSMHLFDRNVNFLGGHGIVGAHVPIGTGVGFAIKYRGGDQVCICFMGESVVNTGAFHEALNMAGLWKLPVVYVIENNRYGM